jgi:hypothetical protein
MSHFESQIPSILRYGWKAAGILTAIFTAHMASAANGFMQPNIVSLKAAEGKVVEFQGATPAEPRRPRVTVPSKPAAPVAPVAQPKPVAPPAPPHEAHERECARTTEEFRRSPMLKRALGSNYNPFCKWVSVEGAEILPDGRGGMYVKVPPIGKLFGYKDSPLQLEICVDAKDPRRAYIMRYGKRLDFDDPSGNRLTMGDGNRSATFVRAGGASR